MIFSSLSAAAGHPVVAVVSALLAFGGATISGAPLSALVLSFFVYGFIGWAYESTLCAMLSYGHFANSGFLLGPCCPIYGVGGIACWLFLRDVEPVALQFVLAAVVCCAIEYVVGWALEKTTHTRFWDYSNFPLNLHGRICLYGALVFGTASILVCRVAEPALLAALALLPTWLVIVLALAAIAFTVVDAAFSLASWKRLSAQLDELRADMADRINEGLRDASDAMLERIPTAALDSAESIHARGQAMNGWLVTLSDVALQALRERVSVPSFVADGREGLQAVVERIKEAAPAGISVSSMAEMRESWEARTAGREDSSTRVASERGSRARRPMRLPRPAPKLRLRRRDLRYFNAFPKLRMLPYEGIIRATGLKDRARELFRKK